MGGCLSTALFKILFKLDVSSSCEFANFFILMTAQSPRHMRAVTEEIESELKKLSAFIKEHRLCVELSTARLVCGGAESLS